MSTFMIVTRQWSGLICKFEKKYSTNGSLELVDISCKHILSTSAMYICHRSQNIRYY